ncbi:Ribose transport system permease protein RbsC [Paracoccus haematequi]|uniref:Ribose transport system permease protein RbsC n=1 Tax=Paracoccus haematequi TaxID=2491866 RepID=A0A447IK53_9RHOB|nr:ABC transporter permease [Paracoccus haematequi]VDS07871.1 Ribose transport system permease protein RbsC [Paracoccus haematequi]
MSERASNPSTYLLVPILLIAVLLATATIRAPNLVSMSGFGSAIIVAAPLIFATYALMVLAVAGRGTVDLSVGPLLAFINVSVVQLNTAGIITSPLAVFIVALGIGVLYQLLFAAIVIWVRVQPIIVALSGFLALTGINLVILPRPGGLAPEFMQSWGLGTTIFSPVLLIILIATAAWLLFTLSPFYSNLRMMGYDERAAWTSGVRINIVRIGAHVIAGLFTGLGALCYTALISSGDPTQGTNMTLTAVTAVVLGGVSLSGGRGGAAGALLGALNLYLIGYVLATFNFGAIQAFVTQMSYGIILVLSLLLTLLVPVISRHVSFISPWSAFVVLGSVVVAIMLHIAGRGSFAPAEAIADRAPTLSRYLLTEPASAGLPALSVSPFQTFVFLAVAGLLSLVFAARLINAEARARRMGLFLYIFVALLLTGLFLAVTLQPDATLFGGAAP